MNAEQLRKLTQMKQIILRSSVSSPEEIEIRETFSKISWGIILRYIKFLDRSMYKKNAVCVMKERHLLNNDAIIKIIPLIDDKICDEPRSVRELAASIFNEALIKTFLFFEKEKREYKKPEMLAKGYSVQGKCKINK